MTLSLNQYTLEIYTCCYEKKLIYKNIFFKNHGDALI